MAGVLLFLALLLAAVVLFVAGVYLIGGLGSALIAGALCSVLAAFGLRRGMTDG